MVYSAMVLKLLLLFCAGLFAGFCNIMAGGGSLLTLPALIFLGLPASVANGTNRVAILVQNIFATARFRQGGHFYWKAGLILTIPAVVGASLGSLLAVRIPDELFKKILAGVMVASLATVLMNKSRTLEKIQDVKIKHYLPLILAFFFVGIYGGVIQAGVGFLVILTLSLVPHISLVQLNSLKILIILVYMIPSLLIFMAHGKVDWIYGLILAAGNGLGGWLGAHVAIKKGDRIIKIVFSAAVFVMALKLLGLI